MSHSLLLSYKVLIIFLIYPKMAELDQYQNNSSNALFWFKCLGILGPAYYKSNK